MQEKKNQKLKINLRTRFYFFVLLIGMVLIGRAFYGDDNLRFKIWQNEMKREEISNIDQNDKDAIVGNYFEGRLENSDSTEKGNLKLVSSVGQIYIRTSRDFSALIGFDVLMTINGNLDKFTLLSIERRVEKDGYIQAQ